jgi:hypothetical protein
MPISMRFVPRHDKFLLVKSWDMVVLLLSPVAMSSVCFQPPIEYNAKEDHFSSGKSIPISVQLDLKLQPTFCYGQCFATGGLSPFCLRQGARMARRNNLSRITSRWGSLAVLHFLWACPTSIQTDRPWLIIRHLLPSSCNAV